MAGPPSVYGLLPVRLGCPMATHAYAPPRRDGDGGTRTTVLQCCFALQPLARLLATHTGKHASETCAGSLQVPTAPRLGAESAMEAAERAFTAAYGEALGSRLKCGQNVLTGFPKEPVGPAYII